MPSEDGRRSLLITAFISGMTIMALEMSASRLLAPYFGTSLFVWTNIIGITMISLSAGYYYGGRFADKNPDKKLLYSALTLTGFYSVSIPFIAPIVMGLSNEAVRTGSAGIFYGSLIATILLFAPPLTVLGGVAPFIIRLLGADRASAGGTAGSVFSVSTVGSIIGTFLPVLLAIPFIGTRRTVIVFGTILLVLGLLGLEKRAYAAAALLMLAAGLFVGSAKPAAGMIYEKESVHNYIQVTEKAGVRYLKLNEGYAYHSIYDPGSVTVGGIWDYFSVLPLLKEDSQDALIIGLAGGTIAREYRFFHPQIRIDGVEVDGGIIDAGKRYFDMEGDNLAIYHMDGRTFLSTTDKTYDIIMIDAYKQPYIPFHLTTKEFFSEVRDHLSERGIVAINVASVRPDSKILMMIENTMASVYKHVYVVNPPGTLNYMVIASDEALSFDADAEEPALKGIVQEVSGRHSKVAFNDEVAVLTDDRAPVEVYTDLMIFDYVRKQDTSAYTRLFD